MGQQKVKQLANLKHTLALFQDTGASAGELHTGIVVMFPGTHTDACLQSWAKKLTGVRIGSSGPVENTIHAPAKPGLINEDVAETEDVADVDIEMKEDQLLAEEIEAMGPD
eukprot:gnl/MRDRNA2_/MRDRNA2_86373_c0_seq9.p1 gnl/MRDRNA2_/MRDRNA2_86373_c0~~gnl/MRDRNA2_/MRDRNA2_86373_c0_seq9.p1  ORF type:complete len:111 (+),score=24.54 gnl/MRDRNA2_/MRDRNA2_86373_c0_seq9:139-471(+)